MRAGNEAVASHHRHSRKTCARRRAIHLGVVGRYVLTPKIFSHLEKIQPGAGGEIQLTDGIASLLQEERALAYEFAGTRYDCGSKIGYLKATYSPGA